MRDRFFVLAIFTVGLLWQIPIVAAQTTVRPSAGATVSPVTVSVTQTAADTFGFAAVPTGTASAPIVSYAWNFGDNTTASGAKVSHQYAVAGSYQVLLTVKDSNGLTASSSTNVVSGSGVAGPSSLSIDLVTRGSRFEFSARSPSGTTPQSFSWDFGDGGTASGASVAHYYVADGTYTVVLTAVDSNGGSATATKTITVSVGNLSGLASPSPGILTSQMSSDTFDFKVGPSRSRTAGTYTWNFGDGSTGTGPAVEHRYMSSGTYTVTLTQVAADGTSSAQTQNVSASVGGGSGSASPPTATIIATATAPDSFTFSSTASAANGASIVSYSWNFGDGVTATGSTGSHRYSASGTYTVVLTVVDSKGVSGTASTTVAPTVASPPPSVSITAVQTALDTYDFTGIATASGGATIASYVWNFGDGSTASGSATSHRYSVSGTFPVVLTVLDSKGVSGTATKSFTATVSGPPTASSRVRVGNGDTNWLNASTALLAPWVNGGGDWLDKNGVFNGPTPTISVPITANTPINIDISGIAGDLLLTGIYGWSNPLIDGQPAGWFGMDSSSNQSQSVAHWNNPGIVLNPTLGKTLRLTPNANPLGQTLRIDKVAGPIINDYPDYVGPSNTPDVWSLEMIDEATIRARTAGGGRIDDPFAYKPEFGVEGNGLKYLRTAITPGNPRDISWRLPYPARTAVHTRFCVYLEDDIADGMTELGVKLMAGASNEAVGPTQPLIVYRINHGHQSPNNRGVYALYDYLYDAESGPSFPEGHSINAMVRAGRWSCIEQAVRLNAGKGVHDGYGELWVNGHSVWSTNTAYYRDDNTTTLTSFFANLYHGGLGVPSADIHYRIAKLAVSSTYIGVPQELLGVAPPSPPSSGLPAWRKAMTTRGTFYPIGNTASMSGQAVLGNGSSAGSNIINAWNGLAAGPHTWYSAASSGHDQGNGTGWENKTIKIDLSADAPRWTLIHPGSPLSAVTAYSDHYLDGLPVGRHTYYSSQYIASLKRVMLFTVGAPYAIGFPVGSNGTPAFQGGGTVDGFNVDTNTWDAARTYPDAPISWIVNAVAKNPDTDVVYLAARGNLARYRPDTNSWAQIHAMNPDGTVNGDPGSWEFRPSLVDPSRNRWMNFSEFRTIRCIDLTTHVLTTIPVTGDLLSDPRFMTNSADGGFYAYSSVVQDLDNDRYVTVQGSNVYSINPVTGVSALLGSVPSATNGVQNRLAYFKELGGIAYLSDFSSNILFMPTR